MPSRASAAPQASGSTATPSTARDQLALQLDRVAAQLRQIGEAYRDLLGAERLEKLYEMCDAIEQLDR